MEATLPRFEAMPLDRELVRDLRSDHAGESGAVTIYRGILAVSRDEGVRRFAREHMATELRHLAFFESWLPARYRSALLPLWNASGFLLGAVAALLGPRWVYVTIDAVETFVVGHYQEQLDVLSGGDHSLLQLAEVLRGFQQDEGHHRDDAADRRGGGLTLPQKAWQALIDYGSRAGVWVARRV